MKKYLMIIFLIVMIVLIIPAKENKKDESLRIRVIANSNSTYDQNVKMQVVKTLQNLIKTYDQDDMVIEVSKNLKTIDNEVKSVLKNIDYTISLKKVKFPAKELNGVIIPGGRYETLLIVIGEGEGKNWWSLLCPEYHGISFDEMDPGEIEYKFYFFEKLKTILNND